MPALAKTDREKILRAALKRLRRGGIASVSLRLLAADLGITGNALYHYFPDRAHLEAALSSHSARMLQQALTKGLVQTEPEARLLGMAARYLAFARKEPHLYDVMCRANPAASVPEEAEAHTLLWQTVLAEVTALHGDTNAPRAATSLWALLHGSVALERAGVLGDAKPRDSVDFGLQAWMGAAAKKSAAKTRADTPTKATAKRPALR